MSTPACCFPERTAPSLQLSRVWESLGLSSLKPCLAPPYPPTLIATHHCPYWEGCTFPGQTRPSVTGLLPSSSLDFGPFPSPALAVQVGSLPMTNLLQWSLEGVQGRATAHHEIKPCVSLPGYVVWPILSMLFNVANTDASVLIHFSQYFSVRAARESPGRGKPDIHRCWLA